MCEQKQKPVLIDKAQADLAAFASQDETQGTLMYLHATPEHVEATNGHILARLAYDGTEAEEFPIVEGAATEGAESLLIAPEALQRAMKGTPRKGSMLILKHVHAGKAPDGTILLAATDLDSPTVIRQRAEDVGQFPRTDRVIPEPRPVTIAFQAQYLAQIAKWAQAHGMFGKETPVPFQIQDNESGARIEVKTRDGRKALFVLMPVRHIVQK